MNAVTRTFEATDAVRGDETLMAGIVAPSGGGKTWSALRIAVGIQQVVGGDIYGIDTENGRMKQYADYFKFKHVPFAPPFGSMDYLAAIKYCNGKGGRIIIVDSMTHEHVGEGGYLETAEATITRFAGENATWAQREKYKMLGWGAAGPLRMKMIEGLKQLGGNYVFCWRAKQRVKPMKINGKTEVVEMGLMPIGGEEWVYEMTVNCLLDARANGVPRWTTDRPGERMMMKLPRQFENIFAEPRPLSEDIGHEMAAWAKGGTALAAADTRERDLKASGDVAAQTGTAVLRQFWTGLAKSDKALVGGATQLAAWKAIAEEADRPDVDFDAAPDTGEIIDNEQRPSSPIDNGNAPVDRKDEAEGAGTPTHDLEGDPAPDPQHDVSPPSHAASGIGDRDGSPRPEGGDRRGNAVATPLPRGERIPGGAPLASGSAVPPTGPQEGAGPPSSPQASPAPTAAETAILADLIARGNAAAAEGPAAILNFLGDMPKATKAMLPEGQILAWNRTADRKAGARK